MKITQATMRDLGDLARLFDCYRQFYQQPPDRERATVYLSERLANSDSVIFLARDDANDAVGFTQLYPTFCSVAAAPFFVLYDLYVDERCRREGVGRALMNHARDHAVRSGACRLELQTATDNHRAQSLYEDLGYVRDTEFHTYALDLTDAS